MVMWCSANGAGIGSRLVNTTRVCPTPFNSAANFKIAAKILRLFGI